MNTVKKLVPFFAMATLFMVNDTGATIISIQRDYNLYGHLANELLNPSDPNSGSCCSTSVINSLMYLINTHPGKVEGLIPDLNSNGIRELSELDSARDRLRDGWWSPGGIWRNGMGAPTLPKDMWEQKAYWVEDFAPGVDIRLKGMESFAPTSTWYHGNLVTKAFPTWDFIWNEMFHGEDVEINIYGAFGGHSLTLTSLKFNDLDNDLLWDAGESRWLDYLDPNNPSQLFERPLWTYTDGSLGFNWFNGGANTPADVYIGLAYSESIPEPGTLGLIGIALAGLFAARKQQAMPI